MRITWFVLLLGAFLRTEPAFGTEIMETIDIAPVWAGHPVGFVLLTRGDRQFVSYYNDQRNMVVAVRSLKSREWQKQVLPEKVGWDSHNYITMAFDEQGQLHVA